MKLRPERVLQILHQTIEKVGKNYEYALSDQEEKYGKSKIYSILQGVLSKNIKFLNNIISNSTAQSSVDEDIGSRL